MKKVLFICIHNSARSQIAEALLKKYSGEKFQPSSAGFEPGNINPLAIKVLQEKEDINISANSTNAVFDLYKAGKLFQYVVTVCDEGNAQKCPLFPGVRERIHWSFEDPSTFTGTEEEKYEKMKVVFNQIKKEVLHFIDLVNNGELEENFPEHWSLG